MIVPFILGLVSSLHCVGMCGPLAMALPLQGSKGSKFMGAIVYNLGRVTTYAIFGLVFGLIGRSFAWFGWQQKISIAMGVLILLALVVPGIFSKQNIFSETINRAMVKVRGTLGKMLFNGHPASLYGIGLLNGLLPCGMVYIALAGALATGTAPGGSLFMALFGLGTVPAMWAVSYFGAMIKQDFRVQARKVFPAIMALMAVLLILRGLNLDIPYVSPALHLTHSSAVQCHD